RPALKPVLVHFKQPAKPAADIKISSMLVQAGAGREELSASEIEPLQMEVGRELVHCGMLHRAAKRYRFKKVLVSRREADKLHRLPQHLRILFVDFGTQRGRQRDSLKGLARQHIARPENELLCLRVEAGSKIVLR